MYRSNMYCPANFTFGRRKGGRERIGESGIEIKIGAYWLWFFKNSRVSHVYRYCPPNLDFPLEVSFVFRSSAKN